nr:Uma2 family endonuclease [Nocardiopsis mwathae]
MPGAGSAGPGPPASGPGDGGAAGQRQVPEPDVVNVSTQAYDREEPSTSYAADGVLLVVEAVSAESQVRDRETKPMTYAKAGIQHYRRIEPDGRRAVAYLDELDPATSTLGLAGIHRDRLTTSVPSPVDIDLTAVGQRRR